MLSFRNDSKEMEGGFKTVVYKVSTSKRKERNKEEWDNSYVTRRFMVLI